jgi:hypothetical protein
MATERQAQFIMTLASERRLSVKDSPYIINAFDHHGEPINWPNPVASQAITLLKGLPKDPDPRMPAIVNNSPSKGTNRYQNPCASCGHLVPVSEGYYYLLDTGRYASHHREGECSDEPVPEPMKLDQGLYMLTDGTPVILTDTSDYGLVGKTWNNTTGMFKLIRGGKRLVMSQGRPATEEEFQQFVREVSEWGRTSAHCCFCSRPLTDPRSEQAGYGETCASKYSLPWGELVT